MRGAASSAAPRSGVVASSSACACAGAAASAEPSSASASARRRPRITRPPPRPGAPRPRGAGSGRRTPPRSTRSRRPASPKIAPSGGPPPGSGVQNSVPAIAPRSPPTSIGTFQSNTFVLTDSSVTCGGRCCAIQCARWSCHSKRPVRPTSFHRGAPLPSTPRRHVDAREAVVVDVVRLGVGLTSTVPSARRRAYGSSSYPSITTSSPLVLCSRRRSSRLSTSTVMPSASRA